MQSVALKVGDLAKQTGVSVRTFFKKFAQKLNFLDFGKRYTLGDG
jgi:DNA-binding MurR/RpiR family transcriptional regulator